MRARDWGKIVFGNMFVFDCMFLSDNWFYTIAVCRAAAPRAARAALPASSCSATWFVFGDMVHVRHHSMYICILTNGVSPNYNIKMNKTSKDIQIIESKLI